MNKYSNKILITTGDPNGVGAEIVIKALNNKDYSSGNIVIVSNKEVLDYYGKLNKNFEIIEVPFEGEILPGKVSRNAGEFSYKCLKKACELMPKAIVTAPVAKNAIHLAGHVYNGQTEILNEFLAHDNQHAEMLFIANDFRVLLLTRHCPLKEISITKNVVINKIRNLNEIFKSKFKINNPRFALCGFNPHAGEDEILGTEEQQILIPSVQELQKEGISVTEPLPADTLFVKAGQAYLKREKPPYDCYIAIYHDQGLIPIKTVASYNAVNMTIGLDIIRTSPGHGTAFDIAGKNIADESGMISAIDAVLHM